MDFLKGEGKIKMIKINIFIICFILFFFILSLAEAKTADEWYNEGVYLGQSGKFNEAIIAYDEALKINPQYADAWYNKGIALCKLKKYEEAIKAYDEALKINPQYADPWNNKGIALTKLKRYEEAIKAY
ncbi:MAG: hypothetical protein C3F06_09750, partial [Candidatus Methanoperedenaceae archaeon]